jgi:hypothetical protein
MHGAGRTQTLIETVVTLVRPVKQYLKVTPVGQAEVFVIHVPFFWHCDPVQVCFLEAVLPMNSGSTRMMDVVLDTYQLFSKICFNPRTKDETCSGGQSLEGPKGASIQDNIPSPASCTSQSGLH